MLRKVGAILVLLMLVSLIGCGSSAPEVDWTLKVGGGVSSPLSVTFADLAKMPQTDLKDVLMEKSRGEDTTGSWSGVLLTELLAKAGAGEYATITAIAGDGYAIEVNKDELENAIVALKENGEWIATADPDHGPLRLVTPKTPAALLKSQLEQVIAGIRDANQKKDLPQLLGHYSSNFPQLTQRAQTISKAWKIYDYPRMDFEVHEVRLLSGNRANARVTWHVEARKVNDSTTKSISNTYLLNFVKESGQWRILSAEPVK